ncbi:MAG: acyl-CoA dehydratase activase-related protein, partial [Desulfomonile sp.]|nr:acyl-CoA dehydratase activase-related protein [Desulfomonile sp.]
VVEIGGQDSKWIAFEHGQVRDFEMNRVCAAGTGSFLMEQAERLGINIDGEFSEAAFASRAPADLGNRCTVFMESDLIHHQNNGASAEDLAAGVCVSIVRNYLDRVANNKTLGPKVLFLGGVAAAPAVKAAFEQQTGRRFHVPPFFKVSGALGAALKALDGISVDKAAGTRPRTEAGGENSSDPAVKREDFEAPSPIEGGSGWILQPEDRAVSTPLRRKGLSLASIRRDQFRCRGCPNECLVDTYHAADRKIFHGGLCDRWEIQTGSPASEREDLFAVRSALLGENAAEHQDLGTHWGMARGPQFYEWFPFWNAFLAELGITLVMPARYNRPQFERGLRHIKVETCLPIKAMAGQAAELVDSGIRTIFHPTILSEPARSAGEGVLLHCPYIQASDQFLLGSFDVEWKILRVRSEVYPDAFREEHARFARGLGCSARQARTAINAGMERLIAFRRGLHEAGARFLESLDVDEQALVVLGKPYHTTEPFLNMNLSSLFHRIGVRAIPGDLLTLPEEGPQPEVYWRYQETMIRAARTVAADSRLFPVMITFFGCGPDPFTLRHLRAELLGKPLLVLEMDEHASRAGVMTRIEAFVDHIRRLPRLTSLKPRLKTTTASAVPRAELLFLPSLGDHSYGFAAAARSVGIDARVLPDPDDESSRLGRPYLVGGECHPYAIILGDYLKLARSLPRDIAERSLFFILGPDACRLGQYPVCMEKVRLELGHQTRVISDVNDALRSFGLSERDRTRVLIRGWEGLIAFDLLMRLYVIMRAGATDPAETDRVYKRSRDILFRGLSEGWVRRGMEEALEGLYAIPVDESPRPVLAVTGDYYTRVVPFANNDVYHEIERLGGRLWAPPTFSDSYKLGTLQEVIWGLLGRRIKRFAGMAALYAFMVASEYKVKGGDAARRVPGARRDFLGARQWRAAVQRTDIRLPAGITAPITTTLEQVELGVDGVLNLITLNCSYGTVVTAALARELKSASNVPMLTLVYDGLKKTNEKTRLEAFMEQVHDRFRRRPGRRLFA